MAYGHRHSIAIAHYFTSHIIMIGVAERGHNAGNAISVYRSDGGWHESVIFILLFNII